MAQAVEIAPKSRTATTAPTTTTQIVSARPTARGGHTLAQERKRREGKGLGLLDILGWSLRAKLGVRPLDQNRRQDGCTSRQDTYIVQNRNNNKGHAYSFILVSVMVNTETFYSTLE